MSKLLRFRGVTRLDLEPLPMLEAIVEDAPKLSSVLVMGFTKEGGVFFASSQADGGDVMWLMESCKHALLNAGEV